MIRVGDKDISVIAEVKTHSPFGYVSDKSWDELFKIANEIGDIISIHTDPRWNGSFELIKKAKALTGKPILAKGIHATDDLIVRAIQAGADWVLVVGRIPRVHVGKCLIEPNIIEELKQISSDMKAVWNSRDLATGGLKGKTFDQARAAFPGWLCQASNIRTISDINKNADAVLVGTHLSDFAKSII
ncbi:MAG: Indole-3-glycerol-phosphate synthase [Candidatus Parcubacteria bacterium]|nr:Indole-3-glycerol-phosphate synthase [Candidatus Parcubacteria bacterium]